MRDNVGILLLLCINKVYAESSRSPNIIFILADDYGYNDVGYHNSEIQTPTLDALAADGVTLENYYVQPICSPSRSQLMTGRYQIHTGLQHSIIWAPQPYGLPLKYPTIADRLKSAGYNTHMVGKWHLGFYKEEYTPYKRGFDTFFGHLTGREDYFTHIRCEKYPDKLNHCGLDLRSERGVIRNQTGRYSAEMFSQRVVDVIEQEQASDKPFFMYLAYQSVHAPLQVPERYMDKYNFIKDKNRRIYAGMVSSMDEGIANITKALKETGQYNNTVIFFSNDNGGEIHEGGNNWPLRGWKHSLWEGGVRGVGFVHYPLLRDNIKGTVCRDLLHISDWYPTMLSLAGVSSDSEQLDGINAWPAITKSSSNTRRTEILHNIDPLQAPKGHPRPGAPFDPRARAAIRVGPWKLVTGYAGTGTWIPRPLSDEQPVDEDGSDPDQNLFLFNIEQDQEERTELSSKYPHIVEQLLSRLAYYNSTAVPVVYPPYDPKSNPELHGGVWQPWMD